MHYHHTALSVSNLERSQRFYQTVFGLKLLTRAERKELQVTFIQLQSSNDTILELFQHEVPVSNPEDQMDFRKVGLKHLAFVVEHIEGAIEIALMNGASLLSRPKAGKTVSRSAFVSDPDGIPIELVEL
jgi:glyoxylase I family protein